MFERFKAFLTPGNKAATSTTSTTAATSSPKSSSPAAAKSTAPAPSQRSSAQSPTQSPAPQPKATISPSDALDPEWAARAAKFVQDVKASIWHYFYTFLFL